MTPSRDWKSATPCWASAGWAGWLGGPGAQAHLAVERTDDRETPLICLTRPDCDDLPRIEQPRSQSMLPITTDLAHRTRAR